MKINVTTRGAGKRGFITALAHLYVQELRLERSRVTVHISTVSGLLKSTGYRGGCVQISDHEISVAVDSRLDVETMATVLAHEMVHVKQYAKGQLKVAGSRFQWLGKPFTGSYYDSPWEIEAFSRERLLSNKFAKLMVQ
jgi:hypothetical protein